MYNKKSDYLHSAAFQLPLLTLLMLLPMFIFMLYIGIFSRQQAVRTIESSYRNLLEQTAVKMDSDLSQLGSFSENLAFKEDDARLVAYDSDSDDSIYALQRLYETITTESNRYNIPGRIFICFPDRDIYSSYDRRGADSTSDEALKTYILSLYKNSILTAQEYDWQLIRLGDTQYLFQMIKNQDILCGNLISVEEYLQSISLMDAEAGTLCTGTAWELEKTEQSLGEKTKLLTADTSFELKLGYLAETKYMNPGFYNSFRIAIIFGVLLILVYAGLSFVLNRMIIRPLQRMTMAMEDIQKGRMEYRLPEQCSTTEFTTLHKTFNSMLDNIRDLKIDVYEEHLLSQRYRLNVLRMQIKPHFLINSLNMVYSHIVTGHLETAKELLLYTVQYFRFMMKVGETHVTVAEEMEHIESYVNIQSLRYGEKLQYHQEIDRLVSDCPIHPLLIHQFVENSIKYALGYKSVLEIQVSVSYEEKEFTPFMRIQVDDNGPGFAEEILPELNEGFLKQDSGGGRFGISAYLIYLKNQYPDSTWRFYNQEGAHVELLIPVADV